MSLAHIIVLTFGYLLSFDRSCWVFLGAIGERGPPADDMLNTCTGLVSPVAD